MQKHLKFPEKCMTFLAIDWLCLLHVLYYTLDSYLDYSTQNLKF